MGTLSSAIPLYSYILVTSTYRHLSFYWKNRKKKSDHNLDSPSLSHVTCPVVLYWGANDWLTQPQVATLVHNHTDTQLVATKLNFELDCQVGCILHVIIITLIIEHWPSLSKGCRCYCEPAARPSGIEEVNIVNHILIVIATSSTTVLALPTY